MKVSRNDPFDLHLSIRGLGVMLTYMHSDLYEYMYYLTFKRSMKAYSKEFGDPWNDEIEHLDFFARIDDPFVINLYSASLKIINAKQELIVTWGLNEVEDLNENDIIAESQRYKPYLLLYKKSKSYKKLTAYYERVLGEFISCLYAYACAYTAQSFKIPLVLKRQFSLPEPESLRLLNQDDHDVAFLKELISNLRKEHCELINLREKKYKVKTISKE
jgi:hypothetical protein